MIKNTYSGKGFPEKGRVPGRCPAIVVACLVLIFAAPSQTAAQTSSSTSGIRMTAGVEAFMMHSQVNGEGWYAYPSGPVFGVSVPVCSDGREVFSVEGRIGGMYHLHTGLALSWHPVRSLYVSLGADWLVYWSRFYLDGMGEGSCKTPGRCGALSDFLIGAGLGADIGSIRVEGRAGHSLADVEVEYFDNIANHNRIGKFGLWSFSLSLMYSFELR
jgi:hypothetical protein